MTPHEFTFPTSDLDAGGKRFQQPVKASWLRTVFEGTEIGASERDGELDVRLSKSGTDVVVRGTLAADLVVACSRCLAPAVVTVREEVSVLAVPGHAAHKEKGKDGKNGKHGKDADDEEAELEGEAEEADVIAYEGDTIVLDDLVRDELLLGIPMIPLCSEACPGIRPERVSIDAASVTGADDAGIDPRLLPLLRLKNKT